MVSAHHVLFMLGFLGCLTRGQISQSPLNSASKSSEFCSAEMANSASRILQFAVNFSDNWHLIWQILQQFGQL